MKALLEHTAKTGLTACVFLSALSLMAAPVGFMCGAVVRFFMAGWGYWQ